jgi:hypothetical protein
MRTLNQPLPSQDDHARERGGLHTMALCSKLLAPMQQIKHSCYCGLHMLCDRSAQHHDILTKFYKLETLSLAVRDLDSIHELQEKKKKKKKRKLSNETQKNLS